MTFADKPLPGAVPGYPCLSVPLTKTSITVNAGGRERRNREWEHPLHRFILPEADAREWEVVQALLLHWRLMGGPEKSWPFRDPLDFASRDLVKPNVIPAIAGTDQVLGTGDGVNKVFSLNKIYAASGLTYTRPILLPVLDSVLIAADGVQVNPADYSVSRPGGVVTFDTAPVDGAALTAGFLFDVEVRFESDDQLEGILRTAEVGGFADITLIEVRAC
ncbi:DUF2460 domain-containing protein [Erythrobacter sp. HA6-11]